MFHFIPEHFNEGMDALPVQRKRTGCPLLYLKRGWTTSSTVYSNLCLREEWANASHYGRERTPSLQSKEMDGQPLLIMRGETTCSIYEYIYLGGYISRLRQHWWRDLSFSFLLILRTPEQYLIIRL